MDDTPSPFRLIRTLDPHAMADLMAVAEAHPFADPDAFLDDIRQRLREELRTSLKRDPRQLELPLDEVTGGPDVVSPCTSPPRSAIRDYARWLRAGGGRPVTAPCGAECPCAGAGVDWTAGSGA